MYQQASATSKEVPIYYLQRFFMGLEVLNSRVTSGWVGWDQEVFKYHGSGRVTTRDIRVTSWIESRWPASFLLTRGSDRQI